MTNPLIKAVIFDAYGTLFDVHAVSAACNQVFPGYGKEISELWRRKQLEYTWLRSLMNRYVNFEQVNRDSLDYALDELNLWYNESSLDPLLDAYLHLPPHAEVFEALQKFQPRPLVILSNGTQAMLEAVVQNSGLHSEFQAILSVDPLKVYKPAPVVYQMAVDKLGVPKENILFVSSNGWDVAGSKSFGFVVGWVNRHGKPPERLDVRPDYMVTNLLELAEQVRNGK